MTKLLKISQCSQCKFFVSNQIFEHDACAKVAVGYVKIEDRFIIPEWCPLEDYIVEGMLAK